MATNRPVRVRAEIFATETISRRSGVLGTLPDPIGSGDTNSTRLGEHLHITLVPVLPSTPSGSLKSGQGGFPVGRPLAYDLELFDHPPSSPDAPGRRLKDLHLIDRPNGVNYPGAELPTFFLQGPNTPLTLLHGSCRKLHGPDDDGLAIADELIDESLANISKRPSVLFLTGDQIYADDVAAPLIRHLTELGNGLLGREEKIPGIKEPTSAIPVSGRLNLVKKPGPAMFTSDEADNHLLSFGEWAAMYLVAWNADNWPERFPTPRRPPVVSETEPSRFRAAQAAEQRVHAYYDQVRLLELARRALPAVRRVLANIPTYMLFDDHEITDDWNINGKWREDVKGSKAGKRIVANGLAAYWAFQAWGNDPDAFKPPFIHAITTYLADQEAEAGRFDDALWDYPSWTFHAPTDPPTIFVDTRTQRNGSPKSEEPVGLLDQGALASLEDRARQVSGPGAPLLIVSPAPVYGFGLVDELQANLSALSGEPYTYDLEAWRANMRGFLDFVACLQRVSPRCCVLLSGDVHYAYSISATFASARRTLPITQLTSSSLKNTGTKNKVLSKVRLLGRTDRTVGWNRRPRSGRLEKLLGQVSAGSVSRPDIHAVKKEIERIQAELRRVPLVLRPHQRAELEITDEPDWEETITYVQASPLDDLIVGQNNLGLVRFEDNGLRVQHTLFLREQGRKRPIEASIPTSPLVGAGRP
jgi:hypothetical protein